ncbi:MAG: alpha/beta hydrolase [Scytolyngbya sp. HA4215-MV1]|jgi:predicted dienelactone hydrolase|nr:alpha/beta hydrolase [Scytolyngbya sp. HA4215-MV1]
MNRHFLSAPFSSQRVDRWVGRLNWGGVLLGAIAGVLLGGIKPESAIAAERVYLSYEFFERSVAVDDLETYARTGQISDDLYVYTQYADPKTLEQLRSILLEPANLDQVAVSQFLYTPQGKILLERLGEVIQSESHQTGFYAIRAALILAASDRREGLTLLNVLKKFPTRAIRIDIQRGLKVAKDLEQAINQTNRATAEIIRRSDLEASLGERFISNPFLFESTGSWQQITLNLSDPNRSTSALKASGRNFPVDIYIPQNKITRSGQLIAAPVIVISHGLGSDRKTFQYLAQYLVAHGFAVAVPEHPGSNAQQIQALLNGIVNEAAEPGEFANRPLDITYLLNELEHRSQTDPQLKGRLNLKKVGVLGQSFGGYTALTIAGAPINFLGLQKDCLAQSASLNLSLLLQCRALGLPSENATFSDPRVKAIIAINPVDSSILGKEGLSQIQVPTMIVAGSADTVAPALPEQIRPFTWLTTPDRYLVLIDQGTHFSTLEDSGGENQRIAFPPEITGPQPAIARRYMNLLSLVFFQTYLADRPDYRPYLSAAYAQSISQNPLKLSLIKNLTEEELEQAVNSSGRP